MNDHDLYKCDDCGRIEPLDATYQAVRLHERLDPGGIYTDRECSECGALSYPVKKEG